MIKKIIRESKRHLFEPDYIENMNDKYKDIVFKYNISNFKIEDDGLLIFDDVDLSNKGLKEIPIKINYIVGDLDVSNNPLTSFKNFPKYIKGDLNCSNIPQINDVKNFPEKITGILFLENVDPKTIKKILNKCKCGGVFID